MNEQLINALREQGFTVRPVETGYAQILNFGNGARDETARLGVVVVGRMTGRFIRGYVDEGARNQRRRTHFDSLAAAGDYLLRAE
jgi:hypothetical protein